MNFLTLCKRVRQEAGISGDGPVTTVAQTGMMRKVVDWTAQAWSDIQISRADWLFMNKEFTFDTVAATRDYLAADYAITDLKLWDKNTFLIYENSVGVSDENTLYFLPYHKWRDSYRARMSDRPDDRPQLFTILPDNKVRFEPRPDKIYTISGEYKRTTQVLSADSDEPTSFPDDYHMMIVWLAVKYYAFYEDAPEVLELAEISYDTLLNRLMDDQLPVFNTDFEALA